MAAHRCAVLVVVAELEPALVLQRVHESRKHLLHSRVLGKDFRHFVQTVVQSGNGKKNLVNTLIIEDKLVIATLKSMVYVRNMDRKVNYCLSQRLSFKTWSLV